MKTCVTTEDIYIVQVFREFAGRIGESTVDFTPAYQVLGGRRPVGKSRLGGERLVLIQVCAEVAPIWPAKIHEALILDDSSDPRLELRVASKTP
jgi:hypothetical protein